MFRSGDLVICDYQSGEKARGRVISIKNDIAEVELALCNRRSKIIDKVVVEVKLNKLEKF